MGTVEIELKGKHAEGRKVLVDEADAARLQGLTLRVEKKRKKSPKGHFYTNYLYERVRVYIPGVKGDPLLHRYLLGVTDPNIDVNHKNRNTFDNRRENLELIPHAEHGRISSLSKKEKKCAGLQVTSTSGTETSLPTATDLGQP